MFLTSDSTSQNCLEAADEDTETLFWDKESGGTSRTDTFGKDKNALRIWFLRGSINLPGVRPWWVSEAVEVKAVFDNQHCNWSREVENWMIYIFMVHFFKFPTIVA